MAVERGNTSFRYPRWVAGIWPVPPSVQQEIARLLKERSVAAARLAADVNKSRPC